MLEEASDNHPRKMIRNLQKRIGETQSKYEEELKALRIETLPRPTKQPHDEPGHDLGK